METPLIKCLRNGDRLGARHPAKREQAFSDIVAWLKDLGIVGTALGAVAVALWALNSRTIEQYQAEVTKFATVRVALSEHKERLQAIPLLWGFYDYRPPLVCCSFGNDWVPLYQLGSLKESVIGITQNAFKTRYDLRHAGQRDDKGDDGPAEKEFYRGLAQLLQQISRAENPGGVCGSGFSHANFGEADLSDLEIHKGCFHHGNFTGADLTRAGLLGGDFYYAWFGGAELKKTDLGPGPSSSRSISDPIYRLRKERLAANQLTEKDLNVIRNAEERRPTELDDDRSADGAKLTRMDLAYLRNADLSGSRLWGASFVGADFRPVNDLFRPDSRSSSLVDAELILADLRCAQLTGVNLRGADLRGSLLECADLRGADLRNTKNLTQGQLREAILDRATKLPKNLELPAEPGCEVERGDIEGCLAKIGLWAGEYGLCYPHRPTKSGAVKRMLCEDLRTAEEQ